MNIHINVYIDDENGRKMFDNISLDSPQQETNKKFRNKKRDDRDEMNASIHHEFKCQSRVYIVFHQCWSILMSLPLSYRKGKTFIY